MDDGSATAPRNLEGWRQRSLGGFIDLIGPLWTRREGDAWAYGFLTEAKHANPAGMVHGGVLTGLVDHAFSAVAWEAAARRPCVTIQLDTQFMRGVRPESFVEARGRVARRTSNLVFVQGALTVDGEEVVIASAILKILGADSAGEGAAARGG